MHRPGTHQRKKKAQHHRLMGKHVPAVAAARGYSSRNDPSYSKYKAGAIYFFSAPFLDLQPQYPSPNYRSATLVCCAGAQQWWLISQCYVEGASHRFSLLSSVLLYMCSVLVGEDIYQSTL